MPFRASQEALEALEWPQLLLLWLEQCRTPQGRAHLKASAETGAIFEGDLVGLRERLAETSEARALLDAEEAPPLGGAGDEGPALRRAARGGVLEIEQFTLLRASLETLHATSTFLRARSGRARRLGAMAEFIADTRPLAREIERCIDASGEIRDAASPALAAARRDSARLTGELQRRIGRYLQQPDIAPHLSDSFYTLRNDRYVLPVKADSRGHVRGIVHDASRSGTTLFIEPEAVVDLNNALRQAELCIVREIERCCGSSANAWPSRSKHCERDSRHSPTSTSPSHAATCRSACKPSSRRSSTRAASSCRNCGTRCCQRTRASRTTCSSVRSTRCWSSRVPTPGERQSR